MQYRALGDSGDRLSVLGLGGHEYLPDGRSRGFNEDFERAITPGASFPGFGGPQRQAIVRQALDAGITFFDSTIDAEKEAVARNLAEAGAANSVFVQSRPEGFMYTYDDGNRKFLDRQALTGEVQRMVDLMGGRPLDFLNVGIMAEALKRDPDYLAKLAHNLEELRQTGLVARFCADTFSGRDTYLAQIHIGCFDAIYVNFNFADDGAGDEVLPAAKEAGIGVIAREAYMKGALFEMAGQAGITDRRALAKEALAWCLSFEEVTTVIVGAATPDHLACALEVADWAEFSSDGPLLERVRKTDLFAEYRNRWSELYA